MKLYHRFVQLFLSITLFLLPIAFALDVPPLQAPVTDRARLFSSSELQELNTYLYAIHEKSDIQIAVLTVPSLEGELIEDYSIRVAEAWQIGKKGKDSGVIMVIAAADRKIRIEVGYGLEATLTDAQTNKIIRSIITPAFKQNEYGRGTLLGVKNIAAVILHDETIADTAGEGQKEDDSLPLPVIIVLVLIFLFGSRFMPGGWFWPLFLLSSGRRGGFSGGFGGHSGRSNSGGGFSGGGGKFGGGGSSGSW